jgi:hypothetical protein
MYLPTGIPPNNNEWREIGPVQNPSPGPDRKPGDLQGKLRSLAKRRIVVLHHTSRGRVSQAFLLVFFPFSAVTLLFFVHSTPYRARKKRVFSFDKRRAFCYSQTGFCSLRTPNMHL